MMPYHFFYQLVLFVLVAVCHAVLWPGPVEAFLTRRGQFKPSTPRRTRSNEPKPFAGLTHKPPCAACEHEATHPQPPPPVPPDPMPPTKPPPTSVDTLPALLVLILTVRIGVGSVLGTCARMAIPTVAHGASCTVRLAAVTCPKRTGRFHGKRVRWTSSCT